MSHFLNVTLPLLAKYPKSPLIKWYSGSANAPSWTTVTYHQYLSDLNVASSYWSAQLSEKGIQTNAVVGVWLTGLKYTDLVHLYAVARAGYIPQLFSVAFSPQGRVVIHDLLAACNGKALIYDPLFADSADLPMPTFITPSTLEDSADHRDLPAIPEVLDTNVAMIFHTSGTTSGKPKLVPCTHRWMVRQAELVHGIWQGSFDSPNVMNNLGSFAHVGTATSISYLPLAGTCLVQTSRADIDSVELLALVKDAGLNRLFLYADWLSKLLTVARTDDEVLNALRGLRQIAYTGAAINPENEKWMVDQGIPVTTMYATTEVCPVLVSDLSDPTTLPGMRVMPGVECSFIPAGDIGKADLDSDSQNRTAGGQLPDGHITGDIFEETRPGYYAFRGRNDDWIRTGPGLVFYCDTKSIEDNVRLTCADLVNNCTVVGHYKPAVCLFIEPLTMAPSPSHVSSLKDEVLRRTSAFNMRLFEHERVADHAHIVVVPAGTLPRTKEKGNIRRKAVEAEYAAVLDEIYLQGGPKDLDVVVQPSL